MNEYTTHYPNQSSNQPISQQTFLIPYAIERTPLLYSPIQKENFNLPSQWRRSIFMVGKWTSNRNILHTIFIKICHEQRIAESSLRLVRYTDRLYLWRLALSEYLGILVIFDRGFEDLLMFVRFEDEIFV